MKLIGVIRTTETREIEVESDSFEHGREELAAKIPDGYQLIAIRQGK